MGHQSSYTLTLQYIIYLLKYCVRINLIFPTKIKIYNNFTYLDNDTYLVTYQLVNNIRKRRFFYHANLITCKVRDLIAYNF